MYSQKTIQIFFSLVLVIINGNWGQWTDTTTCTKTCGSGTLTRTRLCNDPAPLNNGLQCAVESGGSALVETFTIQCNTQACSCTYAIFKIAFY